MSESEDPKGWNNPETARAYGRFASEFSLYQETSRDLVDFAQIEPGMKVVDLACGTGETTKAILKKMGDTGQIYAVDMSEVMLEEARHQVNSPNIRFLQALSGNLSQVVLEPVDLVISNSAFWQFKLNAALEAIAQVLKPEGELVFNLPNTYFEMPPGTMRFPRTPPLSLLMISAAQTLFNYDATVTISSLPRLDENTLLAALLKHGFRVAATEIKKYEKTAKENYEWYKIPAMTEAIMPELSSEQRIQALEEGYKQVDKTAFFPSYWMSFRVQKQN
jgi:ubiquinone/menaquinone biosynthesis C-methylase UbiE